MKSKTIDFTNLRERSARLQALAKMKSEQVSPPLDLIEDLLCLDVSNQEKIALVELVADSDNLNNEHFITSQAAHWHQDLATASLRHWAQSTDTRLWYRQIPLLLLPHLPQRVKFAILDILWRTGSPEMLRLFNNMPDIEGHSSAFQGLVLQRATQFDFGSSRLTALARKIIAQIALEPLPDDKAIAAAVGYLLRFEPKELENVLGIQAGASPWLDLVRAALDQNQNENRKLDKLNKLLEKPPKTKTADRIIDVWPATWNRHQLKPETLARALALLQSEPALFEARINRRPSQMLQPYPLWDFFAGISSSTITTALTSLHDHRLFSKASHLLWTLLSRTDRKIIATNTQERLQNLSDGDERSGVIRLLHPWLKSNVAAIAALNAGAHQAREALLIKEESAMVEILENLDKAQPQHAVRSFNWNQPFTNLMSATESYHENAGRRAFFDVAFRKQPSTSAANSHGNNSGSTTNFWDQLSRAWQHPEEKIINELATAARQQTGVFRLAYISTLGRFAGIDAAALKLLDFVRSNEEDEIRAVIHALAGIGTQRALLELIGAITRPNITISLQMDIAQVLAGHDLSQLQSELRSAIRELSPPPNVEDGKFELRETLSSLLQPVREASQPMKPALQSNQGTRGVVSDQDLDQMLSGKIPHYRDLSSEVKRALRTAQFFHMQVSSDTAPEHIDLSPVIDMQYKAMELFFREVFEEYCSDVINTGNIQRRLDVIGYARPVPSAMDDFENYIASLPIVRDIPFFSKFKLRKMLRAICQYRPGKRFTLDGLKAFGLFFLVFGRSQCRFGLQGICRLGLTDDAALAQFTRSLHVFQDFRNRAAHEGFHPDASNDINGIWLNTAEIVQTSFQIRTALFEPTASSAAGGTLPAIGRTPGSAQTPAPAVIIKRLVS